ncbi:selenium cofactor biosynthesis protein YqeC [Proteiniclasticum sp. QWL-01]|uniref:selenium cofactor biosynthesis protein YqeC n=1 Tax=Proteiniclasticum sp. QWL-01 TaxID=3036945 RepID=UPI0021FC8055|nr:selenium cofactor biosynthesis protein YqeC [Proteiniclasticum sp. QWL-01]UUM13206.1 selenium cofactor biosynthesis protein YqeC [Clostridiaceae bacterium HFYG-1003]WFF71632.1 selenium cofactor biosynthesis protein YqeC [Proteiniclasticum sp. QWL-01]
MNLSRLILDQTHHAAALIGSGGKTMLIRILARENRSQRRVLVSNTISMERIPEKEIDFVDYEFRQDYSLCEYPKPGVYVLAYDLDQDNTMRGLPLDVLERQMECFDLCLIECDESRQRPVKAWRPNEPDLPKTTDVTIAILDIGCLGLKISVETVHNLDVFCDLTGKKVGDIITREDIKKLVLHPDMMFRNAKGTTVLFINKVENPITEEYARDLAREIAKSPASPDRIIIGSLLNETYELI